MAHLVDDADKARFLANRILDEDRTAPIVGIAVPKWLSEPFIPAARLDKAVGGTASVYVIRTGDASWELTYRLPSGLDLYGSALRIWWPGVSEDAKRHDHPLIFVNDRSDASSVIAQIRELLSLDETTSEPPPPEPGSEHAAVVTRIVPTGAELELANGTPAFAHTSHLSRHGLAPSRVVRVGQSVRVCVSQQRDRSRAAVTLLPFEPEPHERIAGAYPAGSVLDGKVVRLQNFGAFVQLLPGVDGLVHKRHISRQWVNHPEEYLSIGDRVFVTIVRTDELGKIELSMTGVPEDADPSAASIYPDGPPWLPVVDDTVKTRATRPIPADALARLDPSRPPDLPLSVAGAVSDGSPPSDPESPEEPSSHTPAPNGVPVPTPRDLANVHRPTQSPQDPDATTVDHVADDLEDAITKARGVQTESRQLMDESSRRLARLKSEAAQLRYTIEHDLGDLRRRVLEVIESESDQIIGSTQRALDEARTEIAQLRDQLAAAEQDRLALLERLHSATARADAAERAEKAARSDARRQRDAATHLRDTLAAAMPEAAQLRAAIRAQWEASTTPADRERYAWREPTFGPEFAASLDRVEGVSRERVFEVCADAVCRRAPDRPGLELHALRSGDHGGAPQRVRADGAKAYRASLQVRTPAARRLHYWELRDGGIELAKIVYHDDFTIE
jgi:predicted RNA-binding protein with RPS1 domain